MSDPQIIDLDSIGGGNPSVNFGGGIELLMNDKKKSGGGSRGGSEPGEEINLDDSIRQTIRLINVDNTLQL